MGQISSLLPQRNNARDPANQSGDLEQQLTFSKTSGSYFGSHFLMCGCLFKLAKPEAYLFGENSDLDLLGTRATNFPYPVGPLGSDEIRPLNLLINIRKESVKFQRVKLEDGSLDPNLYQLNFIFDCDCPCSVQIHYNAREVYSDGEIKFMYRSRRPQCSDIYHFDMGSDQQFNSFIFNASKWDLNDLSYVSGLFFPLVIAIRTEGIEKTQLQTTMCTLEIANDNSKSVIIKPLRQKIVCDGISYLLQEIFGIENKETYDDSDDSGLECIICLSEIRDTVILPCRHLCICGNCADNLRNRLNNCPICRSPFRALIRLRAHRQTRNQIFETISIVEGLNGSHGTPASTELFLGEEPSGRHRQSNRNRKSLHQVLTMEQLDDDKCVDSECIEMTYIANETDNPIYVEDQDIKSVKDDVIDKGGDIDDDDELNYESAGEEIDDQPATSTQNGAGDHSDDDDHDFEESVNKQTRKRSIQVGSRNSSSKLLQSNQ